MKAYYNENDSKTAAWLRELIHAGHIPAGDVDERSIVEVKPHELTGYIQQHFFAGIGGWSLALKLAGWPEDKPVRTGSCPCQPFSQTGKRLGTKDERHLWPHFRDLITFGESTITFGEQVSSPLGREWLAGVRADLEGLGYEVGAADLCVASVGAPHIRPRLYWVAHTKGEGRRTRTVLHKKQQKRHSRTRNGSTTSRLADTNGRESSDRELQRGRRYLQQPENEATGGMVLSNGAGRNAGQPASTPAGHGDSVESASGVNGMGHTNKPGLQGRNERIIECDHQWPVGTTNLVVCCEDGKARRFEPGSFPLAYGIPHRVGLLRGYGNAINPQLAAQFIQACVEAIEMT